MCSKGKFKAIIFNCNFSKRSLTQFSIITLSKLYQVALALRLSVVLNTHWFKHHSRRVFPLMSNMINNSQELFWFLHDSKTNKVNQRTPQLSIFCHLKHWVTKTHTQTDGTLLKSKTFLDLSNDLKRCKKGFIEGADVGRKLRRTSEPQI